MKTNNVFIVPCAGEDHFCRAWIEFTTPYHKLTAREKDVAARLLVQYFKFYDSVIDPEYPTDPEKLEVLYDLIWSRKSKKDMMDSLKMSQAHFQMVLAKLKTAGFLQGNRIFDRYIPHLLKDDSRFILKVVFDWSSRKNPVNRVAEDTKLSDDE